MKSEQTLEKALQIIFIPYYKCEALNVLLYTSIENDCLRHFNRSLSLLSCICVFRSLYSQLNECLLVLRWKAATLLSVRERETTSFSLKKAGEKIITGQRTPMAANVLLCYTREIHEIRKKPVLMYSLSTNL